jgi:hypothetical protein
MKFIYFFFLLINPFWKHNNRHRLIFSLKDLIPKRIQIFSVNKVKVKRIDEFPWIKNLGQIDFNVIVSRLNNKIDTFDNNLFGKVTAKKPEQLIIVKSVSLVIFELKNLDKIMQKADSVKSGLVKRGEWLKKHMLALVALGEELWDGLLWSKGVLCKRKVTLRRKILVHYARMV